MDLLVQLMDLLKSLGSLSASGKITAIVLFVIAAWKSSYFKPYWDKFGSWKILVAPFLGVVVALLSIHPLSGALIWQGLLSGALSIAVHELLDAAKGLPGLGAVYVKWISFVENLLQAPKV